MTDTLTIAEAAGHLGITHSYAYTLRRKGILVEVAATGNAARVTRESVDAYAAERRIGRPRRDISELGERQRKRREQEQ